VKRSAARALVALCVITSAATVDRTAGATPLDCAAADPTQVQAEMFATDNTAVITDPQDRRLRDPLTAFEFRVDADILRALALPLGSTRVEGVYWSDSAQQATYESSREFHITCIDGPGLHDLAGSLRTEFRQDSVLTFRPLPRAVAAADAMVAQVPGLTITRVHDALVADPVIRERLGGASVTDSGIGILVANRTDLDLVRRFVIASGGDWEAATIRYGSREFVE
jgi:hypothetical protein